jgi:hypothetical protein
MTFAVCPRKDVTVTAQIEWYEYITTTAAMVKLKLQRFNYVFPAVVNQYFLSFFLSS